MRQYNKHESAPKTIFIRFHFPSPEEKKLQLYTIKSIGALINQQHKVAEQNRMQLQTV